MQNCDTIVTYNVVLGTIFALPVMRYSSHVLSVRIRGCVGKGAVQVVCGITICHTFHTTRHTSHVTHHTSHITRHTSHIPHHTSQIENAQWSDLSCEFNTTASLRRLVTDERFSHELQVRISRFATRIGLVVNYYGFGV
jgi:hypothetical protein